MNNCEPHPNIHRYIPVLSIAGSDSCGGAGIQADIKTISATGCYAMTAITAITVQNTLGVESVDGVAPATVAAQIRTVCSDIMPRGVKTGMLYSADTVETVADTIGGLALPNIVVDPVMVSTSGSLLLRGDDVVERFARRMFPLATLLTPNVHEARAFTATDDPARQIEAFHKAGCRNILLKGGDSREELNAGRVPDDEIRYTLSGTQTNGPTVTDLLSTDYGRRLVAFISPAIDTPNTHGTGCTLSSAIASYLAMGIKLEDAVGAAKRYITMAIAAGANVRTGSGHGPVNHFFSPKQQIKSSI